MRLCLLFTALQACLSYKFLVYSPLFGHSHTTFMAKIADTLTAAGHEVTFLVPIMDTDLVGRGSVTLTKDVITIDGTPRIYETMKDMHNIVLKAMWELSPDVFGMLQMFQNVTEMSEATCQHVMRQDEVFAELRKRNYDVGILEPTSICGFGVFEHIGVPATIGAISAAQIDIISYYLGEPLAPSYVPSMSGADGDQMGLLARAANLLSTVAGFKFVTGILEKEGNIVKEKLGDKWPGIGNLIAKSSFMFTNANPYLNYPRPLIHKTVEIGGITIDAKNPGTVGEKWDKALNERKDNVFISFGSVAKSSNMPELWRESILTMCASLPNITFIWKYEAETDMADHIPNLYLSPWLPQNALLSDKRLSLFITHGGLGSITEVAHIGKPAITIPLFADQPRNAEMLARQGGAIALHKVDLARPEVLKKTIQAVLSDSKYKNAATRLANMLKEQPFTPSELVVKHAEFVAKFGTLTTLDPQGRHLSFVEYYFIDVILLLLSLIVVILGMVDAAKKASMRLFLSAVLLFLLYSNVEAGRRVKAKSCKRTAFNRRTTNYQAWREQMTVCDLLQEYDAAVRPSGRTPWSSQKGPVLVTTSLDVRSISAVSEKNMEFVAQFRFRQEWYDDRLRFIEHQGPLSADYRNFEFIHVARDQKLWIPDTFFQNERKGWYHMLDQENKFLKIRSDGKLIYDRRLTLHLACSMHLSRYPMDTQNCEIAFASYAYTTDDIKYEWDSDAIKFHIGANGALPNFEIAEFKNGTCHSKTNTGEYSCLKVELKLKRVFSFFLLQLYIPSSMLVGVAWVSYWIDWKSTAARVPLAIITLLTMISTSHAVNSNLPPVSYAKSIDIWVGACVVFIFFSLIEYAVVNYMGIMDEHRQMRKAACNRSRLSNVIDTDMYMQSADMMTSPTSVGDFSPQEKKRLLRRKRKKSFEMREGAAGVHEMTDMLGPPRSAGMVEEGWTFHDTTDLVYIGQRKRVELVRWCSVLSSRGRAERIDIIARIIFPIAFICFNFAYWSVYLDEEG